MAQIVDTVYIVQHTKAYIPRIMVLIRYKGANVRVLRAENDRRWGGRLLGVTLRARSPCGSKLMPNNFIAMAGKRRSSIGR